ncbi:hypothetical protein HUJ04_002703 [Dendroctonus ponderosae]|nr:hypothetical protein HUJ04_002703 [Dendroctonus ponderosae]KAH1013753.1 hypothetical protein HUJ04_002703 [Dendroctonus ponderosae]
MVQFAEPEPPKPSERPKTRQQGLDQLGKRIVRWWEKESIQYAYDSKESHCMLLRSREEANSLTWQTGQE